MKTIAEIEAAATDAWDAYQALLNAGAPDHELEAALGDLEIAQEDLQAFQELEEGLAEILEAVS